MILPLTVDASDVHRRRIWESWDQRDGRCGHWPGILEVGAAIRAADLANLHSYRRPAPLQTKVEQHGQLSVSVTVDPEDARRAASGDRGLRLCGAPIEVGALSRRDPMCCDTRTRAAVPVAVESAGQRCGDVAVALSHEVAQPPRRQRWPSAQAVRHGACRGRASAGSVVSSSTPTCGTLTRGRALSMRSCRSSHGGSPCDRDNLRLAHLRCNQQRGNGVRRQRPTVVPYRSERQW